MKKNLLLIFSLSIIVFMSSYKMLDDVITKMGMQHQTAQYYISNNFLGNFDRGNADGNDFEIPYVKMLPSIIAGDKTTIAKDLCAYIKQYVNSQEFFDTYTKKRNEAKPTEEPWRPDQATIADQKKSIKENEKMLAEFKKNKQISAATIQQMEKGIADQKKMIEEWSDPAPNNTKWEKNYPVDPAVLIKRRLEEYLALVATVDFNATLTAPDKYGKKKFVNPEFEKKSEKWKAVFRAGKEVNDVVIAFAKDWLKGPILTAEKTSMKDYTTLNKSTGNAAGQTNTNSNSNANAPSPTIPVTEKKEKSSLLNKAKSKAKLILH